MSVINLDLFSNVYGHAYQSLLTESLIFNMNREEFLVQSYLRFYLNRFIVESSQFIIQAFSCRFIICCCLPHIVEIEWTKIDLQQIDSESASIDHFH